MRLDLQATLAQFKDAAIGTKKHVRIPHLPAGQVHVFQGEFVWMPNNPSGCGLKGCDGTIHFPIVGISFKDIEELGKFFETRTFHASQLL